MTKIQIIDIQKRVGTEPDGFWGPASEEACRRYLRALMPKTHPFPTQAQVWTNKSAFGPRGFSDGASPKTTSIVMPFTTRLYGQGAALRTISVNEVVAPSLRRVFDRIVSGGIDIGASGLDKYYGCYNPRSIRGANVASMHAYAVAVDFDADRNGNRTHWPTRAHMPLSVMECFAAEGWAAGGAFFSRDGMHFEATKR